MEKSFENGDYEMFKHYVTQGVPISNSFDKFKCVVSRKEQNIAEFIIDNSDISSFEISKNLHLFTFSQLKIIIDIMIKKKIILSHASLLMQFGNSIHQKDINTCELIYSYYPAILDINDRRVHFGKSTKVEMTKWLIWKYIRQVTENHFDSIERAKEFKHTLDTGKISASYMFIWNLFKKYILPEIITFTYVKHYFLRIEDSEGEIFKTNISNYLF